MTAKAIQNKGKSKVTKRIKPDDVTILTPDNRALLKQCVHSVLAVAPSRVRDEICAVIEDIADGKAIHDSLQLHHTSWAQIQGYKRHYPQLLTLIETAMACGAESRQLWREACADRRAFEGVEQPVFSKGEQVGTRLEFSDRLAEIQLKAHSPKYRDADTNTTVNVQVQALLSQLSGTGAGSLVTVTPDRQPRIIEQEASLSAPVEASPVGAGGSVGPAQPEPPQAQQ